uniref:WW domain-containing protein n=1 Tax=Syphacia muris TaxID=451379 RepID=A0A0N5AFF3_9BILA
MASGSEGWMQYSGHVDRGNDFCYLSVCSKWQYYYYTIGDIWKEERGLSGEIEEEEEEEEEGQEEEENVVLLLSI